MSNRLSMQSRTCNVYLQGRALYGTLDSPSLHIPIVVILAFQQCAPVVLYYASQRRYSCVQTHILTREVDSYYEDQKI
jgi:hypothetical protein